MAGIPEEPTRDAIPKTQLLGRDWKKEVGGVGFNKAKIRQKFYLERAKLKLKSESLKLRTQKDIDSIFDAPKEKGFLDYEDIKKAHDINVVVGARITLSGALNDLFTHLLPDADRKQIEREIALTLYYLSHHENDVRGKRINVDLLRDGETIEIKEGKLSVVGKNGKKRIDNVFIRRPSGKIFEGEGVKMPE